MSPLEAFTGYKTVEDIDIQFEELFDGSISIDGGTLNVDLTQLDKDLKENRTRSIQRSRTRILIPKQGSIDC